MIYKSESKQTLLKILLVFFCFFTLSIGSIVAGRLNEPPEVGDGHDYDMIGFSLSRGFGYSNYWSNPEWRRPYEEFKTDGRYAELLKRNGEIEPTSYRPPLLPLTLSVLYSIFGREFIIWRLLAGLMVSLSISWLIICMSKGKLKLIEIYLAVALIFFDFGLQHVTFAYLTEAPALLLLACASVLLTKILEFDLTLKKYLMLGISLALLLLIRSQFIFVVIGMTIVAMVHELRKNSGTYPGKCSLLLVTGALLCLAPWLRYNIKLNGWTHPLGSQGPAAMIDAYSDQILETRGVWMGQKAQLARAEFDKIPRNTLDQAKIQEEWIRYQDSIWKQWILDNYSKLPKLFFIKCKSFLWDANSTFEKLVLHLFLICSLLQRKSMQVRVNILIFLLLLLTIGITYNAPAARFILPLHGIFLATIVSTLSAYMPFISNKLRLKVRSTKV